MKKKTITEEEVHFDELVEELDDILVKPCKDCPDYSHEDIIQEKILMFKSKGFNNNQIASMLRVHKEYVDKVK